MREVLADLCRRERASRPQAGGAARRGWRPGLDGRAWASPVSRQRARDRASVETVSRRNDAELGAFVLRLLQLFENPKHRMRSRGPAALPAGRGRGPGGGPARSPGRQGRGHRGHGPPGGAGRRPAGARAAGRADPAGPGPRRAAGVEIEKER